MYRSSLGSIGYKQQGDATVSFARGCLFAFVTSAIASVFAASTGKGIGPSIRALAVSAEAREQMERYSLKALENGDATNTVRGLVFTPKGGAARPMVVYIPGNGEIGDVARQFRQRAIFERVTSAEF